MSTMVKRNTAGERRESQFLLRLRRNAWSPEIGRRMGPCGNYGETQDCRSAAGELVFVETASKRVIAGDRQEDGALWQLR